MALSIQSNSAATTIRNQLNRTNDGLSVALERLGTGFRINSAKDDAAGLQIATRLSAQLVGQETAINNANNASAMLQTAEGAFEEMTNIAYRMKELATQGANGTNSTEEYTALNGEFAALTAELTSIMENTSFGAGTTLLDSTTGKLGSGSVTFQIGSSAAETLSVDISADVTLVDTAITALGTGPSTQAAAQASMADVDDLLESIGSARA
ncbi:MAG: Lateral flagellin, partial [Gammaproteobacteria bacterium]|nr:Lateral flagellin [Gammaproteobacteria bacterium]